MTGAKPQARPALAPLRTCIGCRAVCPAGELVRLNVRQERLEIAPAGSVGRGAWLHARAECVRAAVKTRAFARAFRRPIIVPAVEDLMNALEARD